MKALLNNLYLNGPLTKMPRHQNMIQSFREKKKLELHFRDFSNIIIRSDADGRGSAVHLPKYLNHLGFN